VVVLVCVLGLAGCFGDDRPVVQTEPAGTGSVTESVTAPARVDAAARQERAAAGARQPRIPGAGAAEAGRQKLEGIAHVEPPPAGIGGHEMQAALGVSHLSQRHGARIFVQEPADVLQELQVLRLALVVHVALIIVGIDRGTGGERPVCGIGDLRATIDVGCARSSGYFRVGTK
jgi:hypothetical protein